MKNVSKVAAPKKAAGKSVAGRLARAKNAALRETIGIDLGDKVSRYAILDEAGVLVEEGSFRNVVSSIETHFGGDTKRARIALEVGTQSAWIERELKRLGHFRQRAGRPRVAARRCTPERPSPPIRIRSSIR